MPTFTNGTHINTDYARGKVPYKRLRILAGPQRGVYVDVLILEAKLGRKLLPGMTVEHCDGDSLNVDPSNLIEVTGSDNVKLMHARRKRATQ
jgi:hypothetical protein